MDLAQLKTIIGASEPKECPGLDDAAVKKFLHSPDLSYAVDLAAKSWEASSSDFKAASADQLKNILQKNILNFYPPDSRAPFVPLAAKGPWIITSEGSVIYDSGGYGMLGFGHSPDFVLKELAKEDVMANVMTPSPSQKRACDSLIKAIGINRGGKCPYTAFAFLNSGSEANNLALRVAELASKDIKGKRATWLTLKKSFHGRTDAPARVSDSSAKAYRELPMLGKVLDDVYKVEINDIAQLKEAYRQALNTNLHICAAIVEPVMGEGNAGLPMNAEFYKELRTLTRENNSLLIVDSIQAGFRAHGLLSIVDYPGFEGLESPDIETFSKAINAGQYPVSVIAFTERMQALTVAGPVIYGNTMTSNPKAMRVVAAVTEAITPDIRRNIVEQGRYFLQKLNEVVKSKPKVALLAQGTGLLLSLRLADSVPVEGAEGVEIKMRRTGVNVIHSAGNSLRFTPHFKVTREEIDLIIEVLLKFLP